MEYFFNQSMEIGVPVILAEKPEDLGLGDLIGVGCLLDEV